MTFPQLFKKTKTGAVQKYLVESGEGRIAVTQGLVGGKTQTYLTICEPKNVGRSNETTAEQQADSEAQSKWNKKVKAGYTEDPSGDINVKLPMKVKSYWDNMENVIYPCLLSPKLDGVNAVYRLEGSKLTLWSRGGDEYPAIPHLDKHIRLIMSTLKCKELNGELYIPDTFLQDITGAVKKPKELSSLLEFHIFDIPDMDTDYYNRMLLLIRANVHESRPVKVVDVHLADDHDDLVEAHQIAVNMGYEGIVIRNHRGLYKYNERSSDVFKMKVALDAEYKIVHFDIDKNKHIVFHCLIPGQDRTFKVKPKGSDRIRTELALTGPEHIGKWLKVQYETLSKDGVPLKPVGLGFRDCNEQGEPLI